MTLFKIFFASFFLAACAASRGPIQLKPTQPTILPTMFISNTNQVELASIQPPGNCPETVDVNSPLGRLRRALRNVTFTQQPHALLDAFIVFYTDEHLSEEPAADERRLQYISGWDGSGSAAILADGGAALWVPSGEISRARSVLSCAWQVIDADDTNQPNIAEWIAERYGMGRSGRVGGDARHASITEWQELTASLQRENLQLVHMPGIVDQLWNDDPDPLLRRPEFSKVVGYQHNPEFTGSDWREKVSKLREELTSVNADAIVVTALDEVAWLLNLRGRDTPYAPLLKAFVVVSTKDTRIYVPPGKLPMPAREALAVYECSNNGNNNCTKVHEYTTIYADLRRSIEWTKVLIPVSGTFQRGASAAIAQSVPHAKRLFQLSPIIYLKAQKNKAEAKGMREAHLHDAVAMCSLLQYLEEKIRTSKTKITEMSIASKVEKVRATQAGFISLSMRTRVAFGPSGSIPDYIATNATDKTIHSNSTLVIRSGGQYDDGTTVVTRTMHYGQPTSLQKTVYTTTLRSVIAMASLQTPGVLPAAHVDPVVRAPLWAKNQDYPHPTGYGVGAALNVREDPVVIDYRQDTNLHTLREGYFIASEPAWYESGEFGVALGNVLEVVSKPSSDYLAFQKATLVPYEPKLIDRSMLTDYEVAWLNKYNDKIRKAVGPELKNRRLLSTYYWMMNKTIDIQKPVKIKYVSSAPTDGANLFIVITTLYIFSVVLENISC